MSNTLTLSQTGFDLGATSHQPADRKFFRNEAHGTLAAAGQTLGDVMRNACDKIRLREASRIAILAIMLSAASINGAKAGALSDILALPFQAAKFLVVDIAVPVIEVGGGLAIDAAGTVIEVGGGLAIDAAAAGAGVAGNLAIGAAATGASAVNNATIGIAGETARTAIKTVR
jgi:hypothetical protein